MFKNYSLEITVRGSIIPKLIATVLIWIFSSANSYAGDPISVNNCGFVDRSELFTTAKDIVEHFKTVPLNRLASSVFLEKEQDFSEENMLLEALLKSDVFQDLESVGKAEFLNDKLFQLDFQNVGECLGAPCVDYANYSISLPPPFIRKLRSSFPASTVENILRYIIAHEIGHLIYAPIFKTKPDYPRVTLAGPLTPLKYHLTVDAIGILISKGSTEEMVSVLRQSVKGAKAEGDTLLRAACLEQLR